MMYVLAFFVLCLSAVNLVAMVKVKRAIERVRERDRGLVACDVLNKVWPKLPNVTTGLGRDQAMWWIAEMADLPEPIELQYNEEWGLFEPYVGGERIL